MSTKREERENSLIILVIWVVLVLAWIVGAMMNGVAE